MTEDMKRMAVSAGFFQRDDGEITSPFIEDIDISELLADFAEDVIKAERERIAAKIESMPFGDTAASFAVWIREGAV